MKYLLVLLAVVGCAQKEVPCVRINQDVARACLVQCQGKPVDTFQIVDNNLKCECKEEAKETKRK